MDGTGPTTGGLPSSTLAKATSCTQCGRSLRCHDFRGCNGGQSFDQARCLNRLDDSREDAFEPSSVGDRVFRLFGVSNEIGSATSQTYENCCY